MLTTFWNIAFKLWLLKWSYAIMFCWCVAQEMRIYAHIEIGYREDTTHTLVRWMCIDNLCTTTTKHAWGVEIANSSSSLPIFIHYDFDTTKITGNCLLFDFLLTLTSKLFLEPTFFKHNKILEQKSVLEEPTSCRLVWHDFLFRTG